MLTFQQSKHNDHRRVVDYNLLEVILIITSMLDQNRLQPRGRRKKFWTLSLINQACKIIEITQLPHSCKLDKDRFLLDIKLDLYKAEYKQVQVEKTSAADT